MAVAGRGGNLVTLCASRMPVCLEAIKDAMALGSDRGRRAAKEKATDPPRAGGGGAVADPPPPSNCAAAAAVVTEAMKDEFQRLSSCMRTLEEALHTYTSALVNCAATGQDNAAAFAEEEEERNSRANVSPRTMVVYLQSRENPP